MPLTAKGPTMPAEHGAALPAACVPAAPGAASGEGPSDKVRGKCRRGARLQTEVSGVTRERPAETPTVWGDGGGGYCA